MSRTIKVSALVAVVVALILGTLYVVVRVHNSRPAACQTFDQWQSNTSDTALLSQAIWQAGEGQGQYPFQSRLFLHLSMLQTDLQYGSRGSPIYYNEVSWVRADCRE